MALQLKRQGITRVRPLQGGISLWMQREFPTTKVARDREGGSDPVVAERGRDGASDTTPS